ncbi:MAG: flagellar biosynthesis activator protein FlaF [Alphaproteobacteria bacterium]|nr:flagellar biosynthesis activator protein FlaF [Alphaproteobacteria bacterium]
MSLNAYQRTLKTTENPRNTEYRLFAEITRDLLEAQRRGVIDAKLMEAIDRNRKLWVTLAADCADDNNLLPKETRAAIISLSIWVHKYSREVTRKGEDIGALIDVNRNIMKGLNPNASGV